MKSRMNNIYTEKKGFDGWILCNDLYFNLNTGSGKKMSQNKVYKFINQRRLAVIKRYQVPPITIIDAIANRYVYNKEL